MKRLALVAVTVAAVAAAVPVAVSAWGSTGHRLVGVAAIRALPDDLPAFLRTPEAASEVGELAREPDRSKGAGQPHDRERDTAHFIDLDENGHVMNAQGPSIDALPELKSEYDAALFAAGLDVNDAGYLPYAILDGFQQLERDFSYWRVLNAQASRETDPGKRAWYQEDLRRRESLLLRDIGYLAHYVGDGAQPHHTTIHYNGWSRDVPNPEGFTTSRRTHGDFENVFAGRVARLDAVEALMRPMDDNADIKPRIAAYLRTTLGQVRPFYEMEKAGAFGADVNDPAGVGGRFVQDRLAAGASELRDLITLAWRRSATSEIGWPKVKVAEVEAGTADPWLAMYGAD